MESSNSGSFQSSSGAAADNDDYDSTTHFNHHLLPPPPPSHHHQPPHATFFDPSLSPFSNPNPPHDLDPLWSRTIRPDPHFTDFGSYPVPSHADSNTKPGRGSDHHVGVATKNPKKRTRASRRAPTTVLTTDTTNFRQMVQEFTGIPAAPFSGAAPFARRLDLFARGGDGGVGPAFPLRPSAQKIQPQQQPSFLNSTPNSVATAAAASSSNYQLPPSGIHEFQKQPSTLLDLQNPMLSFQSLLQTTVPQSSHLSGFPSSSKRWRGHDEKLENFEGVNGNNPESTGQYKLNSGLEGGDQPEGNEEFLSN